MGDTDKLFEEIMMEEPPKWRGKRRRKSRKPQQRKQQQPQPQAELGDDEMSHEQAILMAFMGIAKRIIADLPKFDDEMLEVLDQLLVKVDEAVRDEKLKAQYGKGYKQYRKKF